MQAGRKPITEETRAKLIAAHTGRKAAPETLLRMSAAQKRVKSTSEWRAGASIRVSGENNPMYGVVTPNDVKRKISESSPKTRLTETIVRDIRTRYAAGTMQKTLATEYGVEASTISSVVNLRRWSWVV